MRKIPRFISRQIGYFCPAKQLFRMNTPVFLPFYHTVSNEKLPYILNYPYRNVAQFEKELDSFLKYFIPVSIEELTSGSFSEKKVFHLSFDDGLRECAEVIAPILLKKGIPATFFLNTAFIDNKALFHRYKASLILSKLHEKSDTETEKFLAENGLAGKRVLAAGISQSDILDRAAEKLGIDFMDFLKKQQPYLTSEQVKKLMSGGFSIGAHSHSHAEFWKISAEEQVDEIRKSMAIIDELVKPRVKAFSFPFTDSGVPKQVFEAVRNKKICDITFGTAGVKRDTFDFHFQRYPVEQSRNFVQNLKGEYVYYKLRKWIGKATVRH